MTPKVFCVLSENKMQQKSRDGFTTYALESSRGDSISAVVTHDSKPKLVLNLRVSPEGLVSIELTEYEGGKSSTLVQFQRELP